MKHFKPEIKYLLPALLLLLASFVPDKLDINNYVAGHLTGKIQQTILDKEKELDTYMQKGSAVLDTFSIKKIKKATYATYDQLFEKKGYAFFVYQNDSIIYWSTYHVPVDYYYTDSLYDDPFVRIGNAWFVVKEKQLGDKRLIGMMLVKYDYNYENRFLQNNFFHDFNVPGDIIISVEENEKANPVFDAAGKHLFSVILPASALPGEFLGYLSLTLFVLFLVFFMLYGIKKIHRVPGQKRKSFSLFLFFLLLAGIKFVMNTWGLPDCLFNLRLFSPQYFAASDFLPSLGDLLVITVFSWVIVYVFCREISVGHVVKQWKKLPQALSTVFFMLVLTGLFFIINRLFQDLVLNSNISFKIYKVLDVNTYTFLSLFILALILAGFVMLTQKFYAFMLPARRYKTLVIIFSAIQVALLPVTVLVFNIHPGVNGFCWLIFIITGYIINRYGVLQKHNRLVLIVLIMAVFSVYKITGLVKEKELRNKKVLAVNLATEHDPVAELLLKEVDEAIAKDDTMANQLLHPFIDIDKIYDGLKDEYFSGYWDKYTMQVTVCSPNDSVYVEPPDGKWYHCYGFFDRLLERAGIKLHGTNFYFLKNPDGRISYFGRFSFKNENETVTLFIQLDSKLVYIGPGYPELLLEDPKKDARLDNYSYAKYHQKKLVAQSGEFQYSLVFSAQTKNPEEFEYQFYDGYGHLVYHIDEDNTIMISGPSMRVFDMLITFSYIFVFYYLLVLFAIVIVFIISGKKIQLNFQNKIQLAMISILLLSLFLVSSGTVYFSVKQYRNKHNDNLREKLNSVYIELMQRFEYAESLSAEWSSERYGSLDDMLIRLSNVFYTDINLYDTNGVLLATSRFKIFDHALLSEYMNPKAYLELIMEKKGEVVQQEKIGKMEYMSAYVPFYNSNRELLAYLNLPYFIKEKTLSKEISNLVVAVINFYVFLILLAVSIAVIISNRITQPLWLIREKFSRISLGKQNEKIDYAVNDEIGALVQEYNRMVDELARSMEKLAQSERESAWREMARQIAHEIKNPLTPMKLNVQQLQRAYKEQAGNIEQQADKVTQSLIDQINNLSAIASAFSNFARMPKANNEVINLIKPVTNSVDLFSNAGNITITTDFHGEEEVFVFADREQLLRVFTNLIQNAIQAIPDKKEGLVKIEVKKNDGRAMVSISDNGQGIPPEVRDKLFSPNFTTKSSGMGLGLAIVKNIIEHAGGSIHYNTQEGKGSVFIVELPLYGG